MANEIAQPTAANPCTNGESPSAENNTTEHGILERMFVDGSRSIRLNIDLGIEFDKQSYLQFSNFEGKMPMPTLNELVSRNRNHDKIIRASTNRINIYKIPAKRKVQDFEKFFGISPCSESMGIVYVHLIPITSSKMGQSTTPLSLNDEQENASSYVLLISGRDRIIETSDFGGDIDCRISIRAVMFTRKHNIHEDIAQHLGRSFRDGRDGP